MMAVASSVFQPVSLALAVVTTMAVEGARATPSTTTPEVGAIVAKVQARFDDTADLRADVAQEVYLASLERTETARGSVVFKRPGRMRWELSGDEPQIIVADGEQLWFYQPADEQVLKAPLESVFRSSTPVSFLTGVGRIADDFDVTLKGIAEGRVELVLDPKRSNGDLGRLDLVVDGESFDIREARVVDPVGNVTRLVFSNLRRNTGVDADLFEFEVPQGVDVVEAPLGY